MNDAIEEIVEGLHPVQQIEPPMYLFDAGRFSLPAPYDLPVEWWGRSEQLPFEQQIDLERHHCWEDMGLLRTAIEVPPDGLFFTSKSSDHRTIAYGEGADLQRDIRAEVDDLQCEMTMGTGGIEYPHMNLDRIDGPLVEINLITARSDAEAEPTFSSWIQCTGEEPRTGFFRTTLRWYGMYEDGEGWVYAEGKEERNFVSLNRFVSGPPDGRRWRIEAKEGDQFRFQGSFRTCLDDCQIDRETFIHHLL